MLFTLQNGGNVGIGTTSPGEKLTVIGKALLNNGSSLYVDSAATQTVFANIANIPMRFQTNSANRLTIGSTGVIQFNNYNSTNNIGTPTYLLGTDASGNIVKTNTVPGSAAGPYLPLVAGSGNGLTGLLLFTGTTDANRKIFFTNAGAYAKGSIDAASYAFQVSGSEKLTIDSSGNVGIGTTSPYNKTHITTSVDGDGLLLDYAGSNNKYVGVFFKIDNNTSDAYKKGALVWERTGSYNEGRFHFLLNNDDNASNVDLTDSKVTILSTGNVGIGTTSPETKLEVTDTIQTTKQTRSKGWYTSGSGLALETGVSGGKGYVLSYNRTTSSYADTIIESTGVKFVTASSGKFYFTGGNVGIGTTSPVFKLQTNATITGNWLGYLNGTTATFGTNNFSAVHNSTAIGTGTESGINLANNASDDGAPSPIISFSAKSASASFQHAYAAIYGIKTATGADANWNKGDLVLATGQSTGPLERMRIDSVGNVGIGTSSPAAPLHVLNDSSANVLAKIRIQGDSTSGYGDIGMQSGYIRLFSNGSMCSAWTGGVQYNYINGSTATTLTSTGFGIGTTSPGAKLDIVGSTLGIRVKKANLSDVLRVYTQGSGIFMDNGNVHISDDLKIGATLLSNQENTDIDSAAAEVVAQVSITDYTAAFFDFVVKKGTNIRSGTVYACHDGTNVEFTETSTNDLGDTSDVTLSVDISGTNMRLLATVTSDDWSVKSLIRAI